MVLICVLEAVVFNSIDVFIVFIGI